MRQISRRIVYMILILLGAFVQMSSTAIVKSLGISYADSMISFLLPFMGVLAVSIIVSVVLLITDWRSVKTNVSCATVQLPIYDRAIESRNTAIRALRRKLSATENELDLIKCWLSEIESSVRSLETERDALKQSNRRLEIKLKEEQQKVKASQSRVKDLKKERNGFRQASESSQIRINDLERERDSLKQASDQANRKLELERQKLDSLQRRIMSLEQEMHESLETISTDIVNGDTVVLLSTKAWKDRGDSHEIQKWNGLFSKIKNPLLRSQQERLDGDGYVYPRGDEARRVRYLREEKRITIIKICEIYRNHGNKQYNEGRTKGMEASKYNGVDFAYMLSEKGT